MLQLHTMAAYFPDQPTAEQSSAALSFINALGMLYPCSHCAADFREGMQEQPPRCAWRGRAVVPRCPNCEAAERAPAVVRRASSRTELSVWLCEAHNRVNRALGKPHFSCKLSDLDERWRTGGPHCDETSLKAQGTDDA